MRICVAVVCAAAAVACRAGFDEKDAGRDPLGVTVRYPETEVDAVVDRSQLALTPEVTNGPLEFTVAPALVAGLALDPATGAITGTPTEVIDDGVYTVTATGREGTATAQLRITALRGYVVDSSDDLGDANSAADRECRASNGLCTLRAALQTANAHPGDGKQLVLLGIDQYGLLDALPDLGANVVLAGRGADSTLIFARTAQGGYRAIAVTSVGQLTLRRATFRDFGGTAGAVVSVSGGTLIVELAAFTNNAATGAVDPAEPEGGVFRFSGGAEAVLDRSTFTGNHSLGGCCTGWGGVLHAENPGTKITMRACTAVDNIGGWGSVAHVTDGASLLVENSTLFGNEAVTSGAVASSVGRVTVMNSTIVHNRMASTTAGHSAGLYAYDGTGALTVGNTLVAYNLDTAGAHRNCAYRAPQVDKITSRGHNLIFKGSAECPVGFDGTEITTVDPGLAAAELARNGGPTLTILPPASSAAIGGVANGELCPDFDQRGVARPQPPAACDIGAVELP